MSEEVLEKEEKILEKGASKIQCPKCDHFNRYDTEHLQELRCEKCGTDLGMIYFCGTTPPAETQEEQSEKP